MNTYVESIINGLLIYLSYGSLLTIPAILLGMAVSRKFNLMKIVANQLFVCYLCCLFALVFLPLPSLEAAEHLSYQIQWIPFQFVADLAREKSLRVIIQVLLNILMTVPFGMYLNYYWKLDLGKVVILSLALTAFIEIGQLTGLFFLYQGSYRLCDIDDIMANTCGGILGYMVVERIRNSFSIYPWNFAALRTEPGLPA